MPRGIPKDKDMPTLRISPQFLRIGLRPEDYEALVVMARDNYRTPELQAGYMLMKMLDSKSAATAAAILERAKARGNGNED